MPDPGKIDRPEPTPPRAGAPPFTYDAFVSYSHEDRGWVVTELLPHLKSAGLKVADGHDAIEPGSNLLENLERLVRSSRYILPIMTPSWLSSEWTKYELLLAEDHGRGQGRLIPLLLKPTRLPARLEMLTYADFTRPENREATFDLLLRALGARRPAVPTAGQEQWLLAQPRSAVEDFTGRAAEREALSRWLEADKDHPLLVLRGPGGMGKSTLAWNWLRGGVDPAQWPRVVWWSFDQGPHFDNFLYRTLAYLNHDSEPEPGIPEQGVNRLLNRLQRERPLLVLDGLERALESSGDSGPEVKQFLRGAAGLPGGQGKVLLTTRIRPRALEDPNGQLLPGCRELALGPLETREAVALLQGLGVRGTAAQLERACRLYDCHPLALRLFAGLVLRDPEQPGDITACRVQVELDARALEHFDDSVGTIREAHRDLAAGELDGPASAVLRRFHRASQDVDAALHQESVYNKRLALKAVEERLDGLVLELGRSPEPYAERFAPVAERWRRVVARHAEALARAAESRQEIDNPYVTGVPLSEEQEIFVGRTDVSARIEQLLLDRRQPPLLLYGQRRMGKTSLLNNLRRLLPSTLVPLFVDLQGPVSQASDYAGLLYNLARGMAASGRRANTPALPPLPREALAGDPFTAFDEWLDRVEEALGPGTALLTLDEFEALDHALTRGRFDEADVLGMLRHLIQHRPRFKVLLAGSHTFEEFQRWSGYLINVQVVHLGYLSPDEARQLIERPVRNFALRYEPDASGRVLALTRGHPFLVQLLCQEVVALKNEQPPERRRLARVADVEAAVPEALSHGSFFFADIEGNQVDDTGRALLRLLAARGEGAGVPRADLARHFPGQLADALARLTRRELIEAVDGGYRFQVELIRRWFARPDR